MSDLEGIRVRFDDLYRHFPHFRPLLNPLHTPGKPCVRMRELFQRFNGYLRTTDPDAPRQHRGGRRGSAGHSNQRVRQLEAEVSELRQDLQRSQRALLDALGTRGNQQRRGTSRDRDDEDDGRGPQQRRRYNDDPRRDDNRREGRDRY